MNIEQERVEFEAKFPMPDNCQWCGNGYAPTEFGAWEGQSYEDKFKGWIARAALQHSCREASQDREDRLRLDWIERNARRDPDMNGNHTWWPTSFNKTIRGPSLREAIDYARRIEGEGK